VEAKIKIIVGIGLQAECLKAGNQPALEQKLIVIGKKKAAMPID
jgi:hypothetical protein